MKRCRKCNLPYVEVNKRAPGLCIVCARDEPIVVGAPPAPARAARAIADRMLGEAPDDPFEGDELT